VESEKSIKGLKERLENKPGQFEIQITSKTGERKWMMLNATPYLDTKGKVIGSIGLFTNIDELKGVNEELELFIYKASHDLRGPLASILGLTSLAKKEKNSEETANYLGMIDESAKKLDSILMALVKSLQIKDATNFEDDINLHELLDEILKRFMGYEGFSALEIIKADSLNKNIHSSRLVLDSVFQNIIENAIKYRNPEALKSYLKIYLTETEKEIEITLEDNGIGIDAASADKIFDMYYRASDKGKGTGLGLYLVKNGMNKLGGTIKVASELGRGTKFIVSLQRK
jgi:signal transduction histidine kinase